MADPILIESVNPLIRSYEETSITKKDRKKQMEKLCTENRNEQTGTTTQRWTDCLQVYNVRQHCLPCEAEGHEFLICSIIWIYYRQGYEETYQIHPKPDFCKILEKEEKKRYTVITNNARTQKTRDWKKLVMPFLYYWKEGKNGWERTGWYILASLK